MHYRLSVIIKKKKSNTYLRQTTAITTMATITTRPAEAEPTMRGSWSCTDF